MQLTQKPDDDALYVVEAVPAPQFTQEVEPAELHVPGVHAPHVPIDIAEPTVENVPAIQFVHDDDPLPDHVPAIHALQ